MDLEQLRELIHIFENSALSQIELEEAGMRVQLKKPEPVSMTMAPPMQMPSVYVEQAAAMAQIPVAAAPVAATVAAAPAPEADPHLVTIDSPLVGVFYAAPAPGEAPFVRAGDHIEERQTVCIIEAMKVMNEVTAKFAGVIEKVLVENGEPVEFGQPLFAIRPSEQD